ncbi:MAG: ATP-grasp domain-containing protein [Bacteroidia bacterium]|nr:ATP-grasp domain-containing protein [Bacteroidia bacterium]
MEGTENIQLKNIDTILIANRGEIARRVIKTCRKMGIRTAVVFTEADAQLPYVREADLAINLYENEPANSYLDIDKIIAAARTSKADAIHPGYGFLSENAAFARRCAVEGIIFIGPQAESIDAMGLKSEAKKLMETHGVPVVPGYTGADQSLGHLMEMAKEIGFPLLLKAVAGGGGKGMRRVNEATELPMAIEAAKREALSAFGNEDLILEKYIQSGRHIEIQIFGDSYGNQLHLFERECSIQRRFQKVIEESPSPALDQEIREKMASAALKAAKALNYESAGTVEFIFDNTSKEFYFLEVNTRLQVEHPVTEMVTGVDLVQMQIEVAMGLPLRQTQESLMAEGYAIEARLYAEDPENDFLPAVGKILSFSVPEMDGLRVESGIESGSEISVFYDPMIAKLIVWGQNRQIAHRKMRYLLRRMECLGIKSNQEFLLWLLGNEHFAKGDYDTHFIQNNFGQFGGQDSETIGLFAMAATLFLWKKREAKRRLLSSVPSGWRNSFYQAQFESFTYKGEEVKVFYRYQHGSFIAGLDELDHQLNLIEASDDLLRLEANGLRYNFRIVMEGASIFISNEGLGRIKLSRNPRFPIKEKEKIAGEYSSPMPSKIIEVGVVAGQMVEKGQALVVLSSMKMENTILANEAGKVEEIYVEAGQSIDADFLLLKITPNQD